MRFVVHPRVIIVAALCLPLLARCDSQDMQDEFAARAFSAPSEYTRTNENGEVVRNEDGQPFEDPDDWRTAPAFPPQAVRISPAYPNPAGNQVINIVVTISFDDLVAGGLYLSRRDAAGNLVQVRSIPNAGRAGTEVFTFNAGTLGSEGLHRLVIFTGTGEILSYGDVEVL